jgi:hypothetical protein
MRRLITALSSNDVDLAGWARATGMRQPASKTVFYFGYVTG